MARVLTSPFIVSISGRVGNSCFRTIKSTGKVYMYALPRYDEKKSKQVSKETKMRRERFGKIASTVAKMRKEGSKMNNKELWKIVSKIYESNVKE
jgi:hypothetical protein